MCLKGFPLDFYLVTSVVVIYKIHYFSQRALIVILSYKMRTAIWNNFLHKMTKLRKGKITSLLHEDVFNNQRLTEHRKWEKCNELRYEITFKNVP